MIKFTTKKPELQRAQIVRYSLSTQGLKVHNFASLHTEITQLDEFKKLAADENMSAFVVNYQSSVQQLTKYRVALDDVTISTGSATTSLKDCKSEVATLVSLARKATKSKIAATKAVATKICSAYKEACNGDRLNVNNAIDILTVFVEKLSKITKSELQKSGYEDSVTYITNELANYTTLRAKASQSSQEYKKTYKALKNQRINVESAFQWFVMHLASSDYAYGGLYSDLIDTLVMRVDHFKTTEAATAERKRNSKNADSQKTTDGKPKVDNPAQDPVVINPDKNPEVKDPEIKDPEIKDVKGDDVTNPTAKIAKVAEVAEVKVAEVNNNEHPTTEEGKVVENNDLNGGDVTPSTDDQRTLVGNDSTLVDDNKRTLALVGDDKGSDNQLKTPSIDNKKKA